MSSTVLRGAVARPRSKSTSRAEGACRKLGDPASDRWHNAPRSASGRRGAVAGDVRMQEVGRGHSSCEADERRGVIQAGAGGAKGRGQGKCVPAKHTPGSEPDSCGTGAGAHTPHRGSDASSGTEVGAVCGKAARTVLCGGREATRVPTATGRAAGDVARRQCRRAHARMPRLTPTFAPRGHGGSRQCVPRRAGPPLPTYESIRYSLLAISLNSASPIVAPSCSRWCGRSRSRPRGRSGSR